MSDEEKLKINKFDRIYDVAFDDDTSAEERIRMIQAIINDDYEGEDD